MPIPTKIQSTRSKPGLDGNEKATGAKKTITRPINVQSAASKATTVSSSTQVPKADPKLGQSHVLPRQTTNLITVSKQSRGITGTSRATSKAAVSLSRTSSASSAASHTPQSLSHHKTIPSTKPKTLATHARVGLASTSAATKSKPSQISRSQPRTALRLTSKATAIPKSVSHVSTTTPNIPSTRAEAETVSPRLRDELYQLELLHTESSSTLHQYKQDIAQTLNKKRTQLQQLQDQVLTQEAQNNEATSVKALAEWLDQNHHNQPSHQIQLLSSTIQELDKFQENSELLQPLHRFDEWLSDAIVLRDERSSPHMTSSNVNLVFVQPLSHDWTIQMYDLDQMLSTILTTLQNFGEPDPASGIGIVLSSLRQFAGVLLREVQTALAVERALIQSEREWEADLLETAMRELTASDDLDGKKGASGDGRLGIWMSDSDV